MIGFHRTPLFALPDCFASLKPTIMFVNLPPKGSNESACFQGPLPNWAGTIRRSIFICCINVLIPCQHRSGTVMAHGSISASSNRLDPLGTLAYYLCVRIAVAEGGVRVPSGQTISKMLGVEQKRKEDSNRHSSTSPSDLVRHVIDARGKTTL